MSFLCRYDKGKKYADPQLNSLRQQCVQICKGKAPQQEDVLQSVDRLFDFVNRLLELGECGRDAQVTVLAIAECYQAVAAASMLEAYSSGEREREREAVLGEGRWRPAGEYLSRSIAICAYLQRPPLADAGDAQLRALAAQLSDRARALRQFAVLLLALSKIRSKMYADHALLDLEAVQIDQLCNSSLLYAKLARGCQDLLTRWTHADTNDYVRVLGPFLASLTYALASMHAYHDLRQVGAALALAARAASALPPRPDSAPKLVSQLLAYTRRLHDTATSARARFPATLARLQALTDTATQDLLRPLLRLLHYRYARDNANLSFQPVPSDLPALPQPRVLPDPDQTMHYEYAAGKLVLLT